MFQMSAFNFMRSSYYESSNESNNEGIVGHGDIMELFRSLK